MYIETQWNTGIGSWELGDRRQDKPPNIHSHLTKRSRRNFYLIRRLDEVHDVQSSTSKTKTLVRRCFRYDLFGVAKSFPRAKVTRPVLPLALFGVAKDFPKS